ncbi:hypothetical protein [Streptomyces atroolivaceus]|uniref:hypothetical protein n=1 Tax=Streptomyces atroolivaceus TaxID=66869 RepID=UPI0020251594|nr:hypothetical protein [Streptomyces atroolivaceus]
MVAALALSLGVGGVSCASSEEEPERKPYVGADEVCDGLFAGRLAGMIEDVTGHKVFSGAPNKMSDVVKALKAGYASGHMWAAGETLCRLSPKGAGPTDASGEVDFSMYHPSDLEDEAPSNDVKRYDMGKIATSGQGGASLYFECMTPKLQSSEQRPLRIAGGFSRGKSSVPDTPEHRDLKMIIVHAMSLMVSDELECENNAGLPETPVLTSGA